MMEAGFAACAVLDLGGTDEGVFLRGLVKAAKRSPSCCCWSDDSREGTPPRVRLDIMPMLSFCCELLSAGSNTVEGRGVSVMPRVRISV